MIKAEEIRKYIETVPKQTDNEWNVEKTINDSLNKRHHLPDNWLDIVFVNIERDIISTAKSHPNNPSNGIAFSPTLYFDSLYGFVSIKFSKAELDIIKDKLQEYGYTFIIGEECSYTKGTFGTCKIEW